MFPSLTNVDVGKTGEPFFVIIYIEINLDHIFLFVLKILLFQLGQNNLSGTLPMEMGRYGFLRHFKTLNVGEFTAVIVSTGITSLINHYCILCSNKCYLVCRILYAF